MTGYVNFCDTRNSRNANIIVGEIDRICTLWKMQKAMKSLNLVLYDLLVEG